MKSDMRCLVQLIIPNSQTEIIFYFYREQNRSFKKDNFDEMQFGKI